MSRESSSEIKAEPNLTPILDMVFQLITFFMLIINFKSAELDKNIHLPVVGSAQRVKSAGPMIVLNIRDVKGKVGLFQFGNTYGEEKVKPYIEGLKQTSLLAARMTQKEVEEGKELPDVIVIRAGESTPFGYVNYVITACQEVGYQKFALKAMNKRADDK